jgi:hypothetical protein
MCTKYVLAYLEPCIQAGGQSCRCHAVKAPKDVQQLWWQLEWDLGQQLLIKELL